MSKFRSLFDFRANPKINILRWSCFFVFLGRGWQHLFWDAPFRSLFWDEKLMTPVIEGVFRLSWYEYATSSWGNHFIEILIKFNGTFYLGCALLSLLVQPTQKKWGFFLWLGSFSLLFLSFLYYKEKFFQLGQFVEYSLQVVSPILLYFFLYKTAPKKATLLCKVAVALTFTGHGLYASGFYPQPGHFVDMTMNILHVSENMAENLLTVFGTLDFIVAVGIFIPGVELYSLLYAAVWGTLTALARVVGNFDSNFPMDSLSQWWFEMVMRLPHGLLPLFLFIHRRSESSHQ